MLQTTKTVLWPILIFSFRFERQTRIEFAIRAAEQERGRRVAANAFKKNKIFRSAAESVCLLFAERVYVYQTYFPFMHLDRFP